MERPDYISTMTTAELVKLADECMNHPEDKEFLGFIRQELARRKPCPEMDQALDGAPSTSGT